jgi:hypothetical protein
MQLKSEKAVKNDEILAKMKAELSVNNEEDIEEDDEVTEEEDTSAEESAPAEDKPAEEVEEEAEDATTESEEPELSEEEKERLSEKTKQEMLRLRERAQKAEEELKQARARKPLEEAVETVKTIEDKPYILPWEQPIVTPEQVRKITREEAETERRISQIGIDADYLETKYPEMDPNSDKYDPDLVSDVYETFKDKFKATPSVRLRELAEKKLGYIQKIRDETKAEKQRQENIQKQEAEQAPPAEVSPAKKKVSLTEQIGKVSSIKELEALRNKI